MYHGISYVYICAQYECFIIHPDITWCSFINFLNLAYFIWMLFDLLTGDIKKSSVIVNDFVWIVWKTLYHDMVLHVSEKINLISSYAYL